jgi:transcription-repair coupling factor (superfamily II helicase)
VGRSHHQAYAYLLVLDIEGLTKQAAQRLDAIQSMEELGSGFYLAMHDLEIRGAQCVVELVQKNRNIKLVGNERLRIDKAYPEVKDRVQYVRDVLKALGTPKAA